MSEKKTVKQLFFTKDIYKKEPWFIPIEKLGNRYITGQDLSAEKMKDPDKMTDKEKEKYPFVIDPTNVYSARHLAKFNLENSYEKAMYDLIIASKQVAPSQADFDKNPVSFVGYFADKELEAIAENDREDMIYDATTLVRKTPVSDYPKIATLLNYMISGSFYISIKQTSENVLKSKLLKVCRDYPEEVMKCFPEHNPGIENYLFILELLEYDIIRETPRGEFFYVNELLGDSLDNVIVKLSKRGEGMKLKQVLESKLASAKSGRKDPDDKPSPEMFERDINDLKAFLFDGKIDHFLGGLASLYKKYPSFCESAQYANEMDMLDQKAKEIKESRKPEVPDEPPAPKAPAKEEDLPQLPGDQEEVDTGSSEPSIEYKRQKLLDSLSELDLEVIQSKVKHHMTPYDPEECKDVFEDKEALIKYMLDKKFPLDA